MRKIVSWLSVIAVLSAAFVLVPNQVAGAAASLKRAVSVAAKNVAVDESLSPKAEKCLKAKNLQALAEQPTKAPGIAEVTLEYDMEQSDKALSQPGGPCSNGGLQLSLGETTGVTGTATAHLASGCGNPGTWGSVHNFDGQTSSVWMQSAFGAFLCYSDQDAGFPKCWSGATFPSFAVQIQQCYVWQNPYWLYTLDRVIFVVTQTTLWIVTTSGPYWYWENDWIGGGIQYGCHWCG